MSQAIATCEPDETASGTSLFPGTPRQASPALSRVRSIQRSWVRVRTLLECFTDFVAALLAVSLAQAIRFNTEPLGPFVTKVSTGVSLSYSQVSAFFVLLWLVCIATHGGYSRRANGLWDAALAVWRTALSLLAIVGVTSLFLQLQLSRSYVVVGLVVASALTMGGRSVVGFVFVALQHLGIGVDRVLLVGATRDTDDLKRQLETTAARRVRVVESTRWKSATISDGLETIQQLVQRHGATSVIICGPAALPSGAVRGLSAALCELGVAVVVSPGMSEAVGPGVQLHSVGDLFLLRIRDAEPGLGYRIVKSAMDRIFALAAVVFLAPVLLVITVLIRRESPGAALFSQRRIGLNGEAFTIYKFRSMESNADIRLRRDGLWDVYVANGYKLPNGLDPRVTKLGALLRRTSLDELPQFINVLNGTMSLVGPRPVVPEELGCYGDLESVYTGVKPGITGYWQVNGRSDIGFPERADLDAYYFDNRSTRVDLRILFRTLIAVALRIGAH
jgi:exopolysaccharide biosynthesis polyprenyl glycosylphosphotransferase